MAQPGTAVGSRRRNGFAAGTGNWMKGSAGPVGSVVGPGV